MARAAALPLAAAPLQSDFANLIVCPLPVLLLALGFLSAPVFHGRRLAQRWSWMWWPIVGQSITRAAICGSFVVLAGGAPRGMATALQREADVHTDMLLVQLLGTRAACVDRSYRSPGGSSTQNARCLTRA